MNVRCVGLNLQSQAHYLDHLAPICILMGMPFLFTDEKEWLFAQRFYPELAEICVTPEIISREYLLTHYDVIFMSDLWDRKSFHERYAELEKKHQKKLRHVHCPHGFSDKGFYLRKCAYEDILLTYGQNMIDLLKSEEVYENLTNPVFVGNYRYTYFKQHRLFFDKLYEQEVQARFAKKQPTILYAPTWKDLEETTSFFDAAYYLFDSLPEHYNMIVKVHPQLELQQPEDYYSIVGKYEKRPNLIFLKDFPLIYPLLAHADIYIGDMSSIGYDFLPFNKPMFFLNQQRRNPKTDRRLYLFRCGIEVKVEAYPLLYRFIETHLKGDAERFGKMRSDVYEYTFGHERSFEEIKKDVLAAISKPYLDS